MSSAGRPSLNKRQKELRRAEKARDKQERKRTRADDKPKGADGEDPDIAGIVPGPQPPRED